MSNSRCGTLNYRMIKIGVERSYTQEHEGESEREKKHKTKELGE